MTQKSKQKRKDEGDISIITVCYNASSSLGQAIQSVLDQRDVDIDYVVIDGGSTDGSLDIIKSFGSKLRYISEADRGIYDAINKGIEKAEAGIIGLLNADDFYPTDDVLTTVVQAFSENPDVDIIYGDLRYVSAENTDRVIRHWRAGNFAMSSLRLGWMPPHPSVFLRSRVYDEIGEFNLKYKISGDYDFILRAFGSGKYKSLYLPKDFVHMRTGGISNTGFSNLAQKSLEDWSVARRNGLPATAAVILKILRKLRQFYPLLRV